MMQLNHAWERAFIFNDGLLRDFHPYKIALKLVKNTYVISTESPTEPPTDPKTQRAARQALTQFGQNSQEFRGAFRSYYRLSRNRNIRIILVELSLLTVLIASVASAAQSKNSLASG
ncbi:hypothetical protein [Coxiella endosymbiont of Ornithodoros maritimus]|uniref:hypothetical protein n=1 Tax=Coxiella endosymbiont of Ornithodoros maritimus TaxID=1656172 RepID=UPI002264433F|nr:hypothetical protein [Coxiella endosymbiont of Ornithodoros maritimus]